MGQTYPVEVRTPLRALEALEELQCPAFFLIDEGRSHQSDGDELLRLRREAPVDEENVEEDKHLAYDVLNPQSGYEDVMRWPAENGFGPTPNLIDGGAWSVPAHENAHEHPITSLPDLLPVRLQRVTLWITRLGNREVVLRAIVGAHKHGALPRLERVQVEYLERKIDKLFNPVSTLINSRPNPNDLQCKHTQCIVHLS